jgi:hypothetical protein
MFGAPLRRSACIVTMAGTKDLRPMESLEFLGIITIALVVCGWYFLNEEKGGDGELGLLALKPDQRKAEPKKVRGRYRVKARAAQRARDQASVDAVKANEEAKPAYRPVDETARARRRFRRQDETRYKVRDRMGGVTPREPGANED